MLKRIVSVVAALLAIVGVSEAQAQRRVALVVGQGTYANLTELSNPKLDAQRMAAILAKHGFQVIACDGRLQDAGSSCWTPAATIRWA